MDQAVLVNEQIDAGKCFVDEFNKFAPLEVAFWLNPANTDQWDLYLTLRAKNFDNLENAYREVLRLSRNHNSMWLDPFQVKLITSDHPLAQKVIEIRGNTAPKIPIRYNGTWLAGEAIGGAYIYPRI